MLYLLTSMYYNQHERITPIRSKEIANYCDNILYVADSLVTTQYFFEEQYLLFPVFLAGVNSQRCEDKLEALKIIRKVQGAGIGINGKKAGDMLELVHKEQGSRAQLGCGATRLDCISFAKEHNMALFTFGL